MQSLVVELKCENSIFFHLLMLSIQLHRSFCSYKAILIKFQWTKTSRLKFAYLVIHFSLSILAHPLIPLTNYLLFDQFTKMPCCLTLLFICILLLFLHDYRYLTSCFPSIYWTHDLPYLFTNH